MAASVVGTPRARRLHRRRGCKTVGVTDNPEIQPAEANLRVIPRLTMRVGVREYFADEFFWSTRHIVELAEAREAELLAEGFRGIDRALRAYAVAAVLQSVASLEAYANGVWMDVARVDLAKPLDNPKLARLSADALRRMNQLWKNGSFERALKVVDKFQVALTCADQQLISMAEEPGQTVNAIIQLRNDLVHVKPKTNWTDEEHRLQKALAPRIGPTL